MDAVAFIKRFPAIKIELDLLLEERNHIYDKAVGSTLNYSGLPSSGAKVDRVGVAAIMLADIDTRILATMDKYWKIRGELFLLLHKLPYQYEVCLRLLYVNGLTAEEASERMYPHPVGPRQMHRIKDKAIAAMQKLLNEQESQKEDSV